MQHVDRSRSKSVGIWLAALVGSMAAVAACGGDDASPASAGASDASLPDASTPDASMTGPDAATGAPDAAPDATTGAPDAASDAGADASDGATAGWPTDLLPASDATQVDPSEFLSTDQLQAWQVDLDGRGLRATGGTAHEAFIDALHDRLVSAGITQLRFEPATLSQWSVDSWSLAVASGPSAGSVQTASYVPYSGTTPATGITAPLVFLADGATPDASVAGKIVLFDVVEQPIPLAYFEQFAAYTYDPQQTVSPSDIYARSYLSMPTPTLDALQAEGAAGAIAIIEAPYATAKGAYYPYDRVLRAIPSVFVDQDAGASLKALADGTTQVQLTLPATVTQVQTRNLIGVIPGASDEITVINSHTDGTNGIEDNGPNAIVAMSQYLARLPQASLPRTIMVLLTSGHFAGGVGAEAFLTTHASDGLLAQIASVLTVEHLGAQEWLPDTNGLLAPTGKPELGGMFMPNVQALEDASYSMLQLAQAAPAFVMTPTNPSGTGDADNPVWPGEGQYFWGIGQIPDVNYITGPSYLLNAGVTTADKVDYDRMRRETVAFTQMLLELSQVPAASLRAVKP